MRAMERSRSVRRPASDLGVAKREATSYLTSSQMTSGRVPCAHWLAEKSRTAA